MSMVWLCIHPHRTGYSMNYWRGWDWIKTRYSWWSM